VAAVEFAKVPGSEFKLKTYLASCLAQLVSQLSLCPLISPDTLHYQHSVFSPWPSVTVRPAGKLGKHLTIELVLDMQGRMINSELHAEVDNLASEGSYKTAAMALNIWARQATLTLPPSLLTTLLLHCNTTTLITNTMKPWQMVKKVWGTLASLPLSNQQLILGVLDPVPATGSNPCPLLCSDGTTPLFPTLTQAQWTVLVQAASRASTMGVQASLLKSLKVEVMFDRIYEVTGEVDVVSLMSNLTQGLGERVSTLAVVGGTRVWRVGQDKKLSVQGGEV